MAAVYHNGRPYWEDNHRNLYKYASDVPCGRRAVALVAPVIKGVDRGPLPYVTGYDCDNWRELFKSKQRYILHDIPPGWHFFEDQLEQNERVVKLGEKSDQQEQNERVVKLDEKSDE
jgi:hypothetical protein